LCPFKKISLCLHGLPVPSWRTLFSSIQLQIQYGYRRISSNSSTASIF
jgi:hypothetical protein